MIVTFSWRSVSERAQRLYIERVDAIRARTDLSMREKDRRAREAGWELACESSALMGVMYRPPRSDWGLGPSNVCPHDEVTMGVPGRCRDCGEEIPMPDSEEPA